MKLLGFCCAFLAAVQASEVRPFFERPFFEPGNKYTYDVEIRVGAGTMDYAPHSAGGIIKFEMILGVESRKKLHGQVKNFKFGEYVGPVDTRNSRTDGIPMAAGPPDTHFIIHLEGGLFKSLDFDGSPSIHQKNVIKAWVGHFQMNMAEIRVGHKSFYSGEETIHGKCNIAYTVTSDTIYKSMSLDRDCPDRPVRRVDDIRGYTCSSPHEDHADGLVSTSNTIYTFESSGDSSKITRVSSNGAFVAQMFETEGVSYIAMVNSTAILTGVTSGTGDHSVSGDSIQSLAHEFADAKFKWDSEDRDLKGREPYFSFGNMVQETNFAEMEAEVLAGLSKQIELLHETSAENVEAAHTMAIGNLRPSLVSMTYDQLKKIYTGLRGDSSKEGVKKSNVFGELLGSIGTSASAMVVKDLVLNNGFPNCRDAGRILSSVPFHIRRPSKALVEAYKPLLDMKVQGCAILKQAIPLTFSHLVKMTCKRAGERKQFEESKKCFKTLGKKWVDYFFEKGVATRSEAERGLCLSALHNIEFGGQSEKLKPVIDGSLKVSGAIRVGAIWAALPENIHFNKVMDVYFPVYAETKNDHEIRIHALSAVLTKTPSTTDMARIVSVLKKEEDYEVINFAYTQLEKMANSIDPCDKKSSEIAGFFLKYLKQFSQYHVDWGFGVSKTYTRQFHKKKFGYAGSYSFSTIGAHDSTTPLSVSMGISSTIHNDYRSWDAFVSFRIKGLAKYAIKKFKTLDPETWKIADLQAILKDQMNIIGRPDQPLKIGYVVMLKGTIALSGLIDPDSFTDMSSLTETAKEIGNHINHQRALNAFTFTVEQPTDVGLPAMYETNIDTLFSVEGEGQRKTKGGLIYVTPKYSLQMFVHGQRAMMVAFPENKMVFAIMNDRIYNAHVSRKLNIGVHLARKELRLSISRPEKAHPGAFVMHSQTSVWSHGGPQAKHVIVSLGPDAVKSRTVFDVDSERWGVATKARYFDCEMNIDQRYTTSKAVYAFVPFNKNPKTPWTGILMGSRQIASFFLLFPKAEKCGMEYSWSQSTRNPVKEISITVAVDIVKSSNINLERKKERLFLRGRQMKIKAAVKAVGVNPETTRIYRASLSTDTSAGGLDQKIKVEMDRSGVASLDIKPFKVCVAYLAKYPQFPTEMFNIDLESNMAVNGKARVYYGPGGERTSCKKLDGDVEVQFQFSTTDEARQSLKNKWYYKDCMAAKQLPAWQSRDALPVTIPCLRTITDASVARKYKYDIKLNKVTDRLKKIITTAKSVVKAASIPLGIDMSHLNVDQVGPWMKLEATLKNDDKTVDVKMDSESGSFNIEDYEPMMNWASRLRKLSFSSPAPMFFRMGVIKVCQAVKDSIYTMDNVTMSYDLPSCWTLMSGHCVDNPSYAVFIKKGSPMAMKAYIGGHSIEISPGDEAVKVNGQSVAVTNKKEYYHMVNTKEIFKITKWGKTYNIYSFLRVWIAFDGTFVNVVPAPSVKGQHCGLCGNYNRNKYDEMTGKDGKTQFTQMQEFVKEYQNC